jgi:hypothetical protein
MKTLCITIILTISLPSLAQEKTDMQSLETDFAILCETSKMATALKKNKALNAADLAERLSSMLESGLRAKEVKTARAAITHAAAMDKKELWEKAAKDAGLKNWKCPTIGNL